MQIKDPSMTSTFEIIVKRIVSHHGVRIISYPGQLFASFGEKITIPVSEDEANLLRDMEEES